jgi:hypothetical protein
VEAIEKGVCGVAGTLEALGRPGVRPRYDAPRLLSCQFIFRAGDELDNAAFFALAFNGEVASGV